MFLFHLENLDSQPLFLEGDVFHHCIKVLRYKNGDKVHLTDGKGIKVEGIIKDVLKSKAEVVEINREHFEKDKAQINIICAIPKNRTRWEWMLEKLTEIGIHEITPLITQRSEKRKINVERSLKIIKSASLQALRSYFPTLNPVTKFGPQLLQINGSAQKYIGHYGPNNPQLADIKSSESDKILLIGPEGDFTNEEIEEALKADFSLVNLSDLRLRVETAAITGAVLLK